MSEQKWMSSGYLKAAPKGVVDNEQGIIEGVSIVTVGAAEGHGVSLDREFVQEAIRQGNALKQGVKMRFGHPNMCSTALGTFLGRAKNFREGKTERDGEEAYAALADIFLSNEAKSTPHGNLYDYVLGMAQNEPDMFGTSIVFTPGRLYRRDGQEKVFAPGERVDKGERGADWDEWRELEGDTFVELDKLHAADAVDDPAANEGLFSAWSQGTMAGQITEFLDLHPQVWTVVKDNPSVLRALAKYADKIDEFVSRYTEYLHNRKDETMSEETRTAETVEEENALATEAAQDEVTEETDAQLEAEAEAAAEGDAEETVTEDAAEEESAADADNTESDAERAEDEGAAEAEQASSEETRAELSRDEFLRIADEFGDAIAVQTVRDGGNYEAALKAAYTKAKTERDEFSAKLAESGKNGKPVAVVEAPEREKGKLFNTGK